MIEYPQPISGPASWYGPELAKDQRWIWRLQPSEIAALESAADTFEASGTALEDISTANFPLPSLAVKLADTLGELLEGRGFIT